MNPYDDEPDIPRPWDDNEDEDEFELR